MVLCILTPVFRLLQLLLGLPEFGQVQGGDLLSVFDLAMRMMILSIMVIIMMILIWTVKMLTCFLYVLVFP